MHLEELYESLAYGRRMPRNKIEVNLSNKEKQRFKEACILIMNYLLGFNNSQIVKHFEFLINTDEALKTYELLGFEKFTEHFFNEADILEKRIMHAKHLDWLQCKDKGERLSFIKTSFDRRDVLDKRGFFDISCGRLKGVFFEKCKFNYMSFMHFNFEYSVLYSSKFERVIFEDSNFENAELEYSDFYDCLFYNSNLKNAILTESTFYFCKFKDTNLKNANFSRSYFEKKSGNSFSGAELQGANIKSSQNIESSIFYKTKVCKKNYDYLVKLGVDKENLILVEE